MNHSKASAWALGLVCAVGVAASVRDWTTTPEGSGAAASRSAARASAPDVRRPAAPAPPRPITFEPASAEAGSPFIARGAGYVATLRATDATVLLGAEASQLSSTRSATSVRLQFLGARPDAPGRGESPRASFSNYIFGADASTWRLRVPHFDRVRYREVYPQIDLEFYGLHQELEYDFVVAPGGDPSAIRLSFGESGATTLDSSGDLIVKAGQRTLRQRRPVAYQQGRDRRQPVDAQYTLLADGSIGLELGAFDRTRPLVIDPVLEYSTLYGGSAQDLATDVVADAGGNVYVGGYTLSTDLPFNGGGDPSYNGNLDIFVAKFSASGTMLWSTYYGGTGDDYSDGLTFGNGAVYVAGATNGTVPLPAPNFDGVRNGNWDSLVARFDVSSGALTAATLLGGTDANPSAGSYADHAWKVVVDPTGAVVVVGNTVATDFPTSANGFDRTHNGGIDAYVVALSASLDALQYGTYLGGSADDRALALALRPGTSSAFVVGQTLSTNFPFTAGAFDTTSNGDYDVFVTQIPLGGGALTYSTYLGGSNFDNGTGIAVDALGRATITGYTASTNFPRTNAVNFGGFTDGFASRLTPAGNALVFSTYFGGSDSDYAYDVAIDGAGAAYITGRTQSPNFTSTGGSFSSRPFGGSDAYLLKLADSGDVHYASYIGTGAFDQGLEVALGPGGQLSLVGYTATTAGSTAFPVTGNGFDLTGNGGDDAFLMRFAPAFDAHVRGNDQNPRAIPPAGSVDSLIDINGVSGVIESVTVAAYVTHTWNSDLTLTLIAPDNTSVTLTSAIGLDSDNYGAACGPESQRTTFDDAAATPISSGTAPFVGSFRPVQPLAVFQGRQIAGLTGTWRLRATDIITADVGTIQCWAVNIKLRSPVVTGISPTTGPSAGGTSVTVTGQHFDFCSGEDCVAPDVRIGGVPLIVGTWSSTSITGTIPASITSPADVTVTDYWSRSGTLTGGFNYVGPPLTVNLAGNGSGSVISNPAGINCPTACSVLPITGTFVTLTPSAGTDSFFAGWSGACTGTGVCSVTMSQARTVTATFTRNPQQLTVNLAGNGAGSVTSNPGTIACAPICSELYTYNTSVTLTATAGADSFFAGWSGACTGTGGCSVTMNQARSVTATFTRNPQQLSVGLSGTGTGTVSSNPAGVSCGLDCGENYPYNTTVALTATAGTDSSFAGWSGACTGTGACSVTMTQARSVTATFTRNPQPLTVNVGGNGSVTSNPAGINCNPTCNTTFPYSTTVTLTAIPGANATLIGWAGACSGTGACSVSMTQARSVTATFTGSGAPTIATRSPSRGSTRGGTVVIITGTNFVSGTTVRVGTVGVPIVLRGTTELSFATPGVTAPVVQTITVQNPSGQQATISFEYAAPIYETHGGWRRPSLAVDRYTAFETALPLLPEDTNGVSDIYVHDSQTDTLRRVSVSTAGREATGGESVRAAISATGRFVAFESLASNLVYADTNGLPDVFLHDRDADQDGVFDELGGISTIRVSVSSSGAQASDGASTSAAISGNGRFVVFQSAATNLTAGDANGAVDVFLHDRLLGATLRVSVATDGTPASAGASLRPVISQNGRFVAFDSAAVLTAGDTNGVRDVFVHDRDSDGNGVMDQAGGIATRRVSVSSAGAQATGGDSVDASMTGDGRFVVYASTASNLVAADTNGVSDVFLHDRDVDADGAFDEAGQIVTRRVSVGAGGVQFTLASGVPRISANGKLLVFLVANASTGGLTASGMVFGGLVGSDPGKSTPWTQGDPTGSAPQPPGKWAPGGPGPGTPTPPDDVDDPTTSPDGDEWGGTGNKDGGDPVVLVEKEPEEAIETPEISFLLPDEGAATGGTPVVIEGNDLAGTLYWNGVAVAPSTTSPTRWTLLAPSHGGAPGPVQVYMIDGDRRSNVASFTYATTQSVLRWMDHQPRTFSVAGNSSLTITGSGFTTQTVVRIGRQVAAVAPGTVVSANSLTVTLPPAYVAGPQSVFLSNPDGAEAASDEPFTYTNPAEALSVSMTMPQAAMPEGGTSVTIIGTGFTEGTTVMVGDRAATGVQRLSSHTLLVQTPPQAPGDVGLVINVPGQPPATAPFKIFPPQSTVATCSGADADGDGMDDAWERQFGLISGDASDAAEDPDHDGLTNAQECQGDTHPRSLFTRYLAEGATGTYFDTRLAIANPNSTAARVLLRFQTGDGRAVRKFVLMPPTSRSTVDLRQVPGLEAADISTVVESDVQVVVDRTMRWDQASRAGAHAETSTPAPSLIWYLAEGATHGFFDLFYLLQNPSATQTAQVQIRYLLPSGAPILQTFSVGPSSRRTVYVDQQPGLSATDVSAVITSLNGVPIIAERAMYSSAAGTFAAGHESAGVTSPSLEWFFAEGSTGAFFDTFVLLANPNGTASNVRATYLLPSGQTVQKDYAVAANSRRTLNVQEEDPRLGATAVSMRLASTNGVSFIAERSMWWPHGQAWFEAHNAAGATATGTKWAVADGEVGLLPEDTATYYLVANTSSFAASIRVTILSEAGETASQDFTVPANSRFSIPVVTSEAPPSPHYMLAPRGYKFGAIIESLGATPAQIVVERAMYWNANGQVWAAGSDLLATRLR